MVGQKNFRYSLNQMDLLDKSTDAVRIRDSFLLLMGQETIEICKTNRKELKLKIKIIETNLTVVYLFKGQFLLILEVFLNK